MASGSLLTKIWKGLNEMKKLGLINAVPTKVNGAQAEGCSPIATAYKQGRDFFKPVKPKTIAKSLAIGDPAEDARRPPVPAAHHAHDRRYQQGSDDRGVEDDAGGQADPDADRPLQGHGDGAHDRLAQPDEDQHRDEETLEHDDAHRPQADRLEDPQADGGEHTRGLVGVRVHEAPLARLWGG